jgi:hypothetical protein
MSAMGGKRTLGQAVLPAADFRKLNVIGIDDRQYKRSLRGAGEPEERPSPAITSKPIVTGTVSHIPNGPFDQDVVAKFVTPKLSGECNGWVAQGQRMRSDFGLPLIERITTHVLRQIGCGWFSATASHTGSNQEYDPEQSHGASIRRVSNVRNGSKADTTLMAALGRKRTLRFMSGKGGKRTLAAGLAAMFPPLDPP